VIRDPDTAKAKIQELCRRGETFLEAAISGESLWGFLREQDSADIQYWFSETLTFLGGFVGAESDLYSDARTIAKGARRAGGFYRQNLQQMLGHLAFVLDAIDQGLLARIEDAVRVADFTTFLDHAKEYHSEGKKMEAAVIASAILEDTAKQVVRKYGTAAADTLDGVINSLKTAGIVNKTESAKLRYYAGIRNAALHASWDEFSLDDVDQLIAGVDWLIRLQKGA
jgi:uncharacterized protein YutE (UPF0331/DUF86 family)